MKTNYLQYPIDVLEGKVIAGQNIKLACLRFLNDLKRTDIYLNTKVVDKAIKFISCLRHFKGKSSGQQFILEPWQAWIVANIVGWYRIDTKTRRFTSSYIEVSRKNGKALALDTKIPTPTGWTSMGDLKVGDLVLGADGLPTKVTFVTPIKYNHSCYRVTFEDGESVIADAEHNWFVKRGKELSVKTTELILNSKYKKETHRGTEYYYRVPIAKPIELPELSLLIDPYILGLWLGDGTTNKPNFTVAESDLLMYDIVKEKYGFYKLHKKGNNIEVSLAGDKGLNNSEFRNQLVELNLLGNKHIPNQYLRASKEQRLALLLGLMDTDGYCSKAGQCEFVQKNLAVSDGFCELLSSLGIKYTRTEKIPTCNGKECDPVQRITFYTDKSLPCFRLLRKFDRLKDKLSRRMLYKSITNIEAVDSVPVKCITVDNPDHLYLFGDRFTVTHNTALAAALCMYFLLADGEDGAEVDLASNSKELSKIAYEFCQAFAKQLDPKTKYLRTYRDKIFFDLNNSKLNVFAADDSKLDGFNASFALVDKIFVHVKSL